MRPDTQHGFDFEDAFAERNGLTKQPGSGNQWHSPLDELGFDALFSLKSTRFKSYPLNIDDLDEMRTACYGPGGTGKVPVQAIRIHDDSHVVIVMFEEDFKRAFQEKHTFVKQNVAAARRERAATPALLREDMI